MKIGRLITVEGIEFSVDRSQLRELTEYLRRQEIDEAIASDLGIPGDASGLIDPEGYERAAQAAYYVQKSKARPVTA